MEPSKCRCVLRSLIFFIKFDRHYELRSRGPYWSSSTTTLSLRLGNGFIDVSQPYQRLSHHNYHLIFATGGVFHEINDKLGSESKFTWVTLIITVRMFWIEIVILVPEGSKANQSTSGDKITAPTPLSCRRPLDLWCSRLTNKTALWIISFSWKVSFTHCSSVFTKFYPWGCGKQQQHGGYAISAWTTSQPYVITNLVEQLR